METLSKLGRQVICNIVGITDDKSIFIKSKDAFIDRMKLYRIMFDIDRYIETYKNEMSKFDSEKDYIVYLKDASARLNEDLIFRTKRSETLLNLYCKVTGEEVKHLINTPIRVKPKLSSMCKLRIYFEKPIYEGLKYLCSYSTDMCDSCYDYLLETTGSKLIASLDDIPLQVLKDVKTRRLIEQSSLDLGLSMVSILCPKFLNKNEICYIGKSEIEFITTANKSVESIDRISKSLQEDWIEHDNLTLNNVSIELYSEKLLAKNRGIILKETIAGGNSRGVYDISRYDTLTLVSYLRKIYNEPYSKYDRYFEYLGKEARLSSDNDVIWF